MRVFIKVVVVTRRANGYDEGGIGDEDGLGIRITS